jgi:hypothetical protein
LVTVTELIITTKIISSNLFAYCFIVIPYKKYYE